MTKLQLTLACGEYDYLQPLRDGRVAPEGIDLNLLIVACGARHTRMMDHAEYDACEFSMGTYLVARAKGIDWLQAIPFFSRRMFCHRFLFVRQHSAIAKPADLKGRRVGLLTYQNSLAIFAKAALMHSYGVSIADVTWVTMGKERVEIQLPPGVKVEPTTGGKPMEALLLCGDIDLMVAPDLPQAWLRGDGAIARLFPSYEEEEREYYRRTQNFPIMHPIVIKKAILERYPWVATSLYDALVASRGMYDEFMQQPHRLSLAWPRVEEERSFFGRRPFGQGFSANRHDLQVMINYAREQGLLARQVAPEEIFVAETLRT